MHTYIHIHIYIFMYITKRKARKNGRRGVKKTKREREKERKREREEKRERESRTPERDENIRRGAPRYHHPSTLVLLPPPIYHPTSHNGSNPRTGFLLHLSSAGRLDAAARCVGGFDTLRSYFQNSVYILKLSFFLSLFLSIYLAWAIVTPLSFNRFSTVVPATLAQSLSTFSRIHGGIRPRA